MFNRIFKCFLSFAIFALASSSHATPQGQVAQIQNSLIQELEKKQADGFTLLINGQAANPTVLLQNPKSLLSAERIILA